MPHTLSHDTSSGHGRAGRRGVPEGGFRLWRCLGCQPWGRGLAACGLAAELVEWWEDLWQAHTGSRVVLVRVPPGWGRSSSVTPSFTWRRVAARTSAFARTTNRRGRNLPAVLGGLVQRRRSYLHVPAEPPHVSGSRQLRLGVASSTVLDRFVVPISLKKYQLP
jgi:hypothetical protein